MHKKEFVLRLLFALALLPFVAHAEQGQSMFKDEFTMTYAQFMYEFQNKNWSQIAKYERKYTKCGFGPGEEGVGCIERRYDKNQSCMDEMLFSLKQGCKMSSNSSELSCASPPQWADQSIIILGARSSFTYDTKSKTMHVNFFICGGD